MTEYELWSLVVGAIAAFSTFSAVAWVLFKDTFFKWWNKPIIELAAKKELPYLTKTPVIFADKETRGYYYHISVTNTGRSNLNGCMGYISAVWQEGANGVWKKMKNYIPLPLTWAHEGDVKTSISPIQKKYLDVGRIVYGLRAPDNEGLGFEFCFKTLPFGEVTKIGRGTYRLTITIYSDNASIKEITLKLTWNGGWEENYDEMVKHFIIVDENKK